MNNNYLLYGRQGGGSLAPQFVLEEMNLPYKMKWVDGEESANPASPYRQICPTGKIPALALPDGSNMFESAAICIHLTNMHGTSGLAPPQGTPAHGQFLQWMLFLATGVYGSALRHYYASRYTLSDDADGVQGAALNEFESHLALIEKQLAGFLLGADFSAADLYLYMLVGWHPDGYEAIRQKFPKIGALCDNIGARPAVVKVMAANA